MSVFSQTSGTGPDLVLIHGWGLHGGIWDTLVPLLASGMTVHCVDLPGHGRSPWLGERTLDDLVDAVGDVVPEHAIWLGWSLGGLVAMRALARTMRQPAGLAVVASTPSFVRRPDWQSAMLPELLTTFAGELTQDYRRTLDRFLALQVRGSRDATTVLKALREIMLQHGEPDPAGLRAGLEILSSTDLRNELASIDRRTLLIAGERDTLVPLAAVQALQSMLQNAELNVFPAAGHAPFLADPEKFARDVDAFVRAVND